MNRLAANLALAGVSILALTATRANFAAEIAWATDLAAAQRQATQEGKLLLLHFQSENCVPCRNLETTVFIDESVTAAVNTHYVAVRIDVDQNPELAQTFQVKQWPTDVVVTPEGEQLYRGISQPKPQTYRTTLEMIAQSSGAPGSDSSTDAALAEYERATAQPGQSPSFETAGSAGFAGGSPAGDGMESVDPSQYATAQYAPPKEEVWEPTGGPAFDPQGSRPPEARLSQSPRDPMEYGRNDAAMAATPQFDSAVSSPGAYDPAPSPPQANPYRQVGYGGPGSAAAGSESGFSDDFSTSDPLGSVPGSGSIPAVPASFAHPPSMPAPVSSLRLGLDGNCPVTLVTRLAWAKGDPQFGAKHRGVVYLFADAPARDLFLADPDAFSLAWQGIDAVEMVDGGRAVHGEARFGFAADCGIVLFASEENLAKFGADPQSEAYYVQKMDELLRQRSNVAAGPGATQR